MRRNPSLAEARLWSQLRYRQLAGLKFTARGLAVLVDLR